MSADRDAASVSAADVARHLAAAGPQPLFLCGDAAASLAILPAAAVDCVLTSPPYYGHRRYANGGIGAEETWPDYVAALAEVTGELRRVLKPGGSLWLNLGDTYRGKRLLGIPWRVAFHLVDEQGWILRNSVVWHKVKGGPDTSRDKLRNVHELLFHFVRQPTDYYYDADAVRNAPRAARVENGAVVSATGVSGVRYRRQIELSTALTADEKEAATAALDDALAAVAAGTLNDFRMVIRGRQRATHSDSTAVSGRARELQERGFYCCATTPAAASRATCGTSCLRTRRGAGVISHPSRPTSAACRSSPPARPAASCSTRSAARVRRSWSPPSSAVVRSG